MTSPDISIISFDLGTFDIFVIGGGGHARVLVEAISQMEPSWKVAILDRDQKRHGQAEMGAPIIGGDELMEAISIKSPGARITIGLGSVGDASARIRLFDLAISWGLRPTTVVHPTSVVSKATEIGDGSQLFPACVLNPGVKIGQNVIVNTRAVVEHDCLIGDHAHLATGAILAGGVVVGPAAHVGAGATVKQGIRVGEGAVIGVGASVVKDVPAGTVVAGVPAKPLFDRNENA